MAPLFHTVLLVAAGGSLGAVARLGVFHAVHGQGRQHSPWTTMAVNLLGCLALGVVLGWSAAKGGLDERWRTFLTVGVLGAFTTFSTYAGDVLRLLEERKPVEAGAYLVLSAALGLALCAGGAWATQAALR
jgi:fluoride exporter